MKKKKTPQSEAAVIRPPQSLLRVKIIKGPHKGSSFKLVGQKISIGRSSENDIVLSKDEKCSRKQCLLHLTGNGCSIQDISNRASLKVNDQVRLQATLRDGDIIQFGHSVLQFERVGNEMPASPGKNIVPLPGIPGAITPSSTGALPQKQIQPQQGMSVSPDGRGSHLQVQYDEDLHAPQMTPHHWPQGSSGQRRKRSGRSALFPRILLAGVVLGGAYLFLSDTPEKKDDNDKLRTLQDREKQVETLSELKEKEMKKRSRNLQVSYKDAQAAYINGIRDYRKGIYNRAIESFRTCRTLYPQHELCTSYLQKSEIKKQQLIQAWMVAGKNYREKRRLEACMSSFKIVMLEIRDNKNLTYKEAQENYNICKIQFEDRY